VSRIQYSLRKKPKVSAKGRKMVINSLTILIVVGVGMACYLSFKLGLEVGYDRGNVEGRRAVASYYEGLHNGR
jgi:hypothetical protein